MRKRRIELDTDTSETDLKRAKIDEKNICLESQQKQQYMRLFEIISSGEIIQNMNIDEYLIKLMTEFSIGFWINCFNCNESVSFARFNCMENQCVACLKIVYIQYCDIHREICAIDNIEKSTCYECDKRVCMETLRRCIICDQTYCLCCLCLDICEICDAELEPMCGEFTDIDIIKHEYFD